MPPDPDPRIQPLRLYYLAPSDFFITLLNLPVRGSINCLRVRMFVMVSKPCVSKLYANEAEYYKFLVRIFIEPSERREVLTIDAR
jgi:hypothetical protein